MDITNIFHLIDQHHNKYQNPSSNLLTVHISDKKRGMGMHMGEIF
jgi:hypothetical protein